MSDNTPPQEPVLPPPTPAQPAAPEDPPAAPAYKRGIVSHKGFQFAVVGIAGLAIGGLIGLGTGFAAGHFMSHDRGHHQDGRNFKDRYPQQIPAHPGRPAPVKPRLPQKPPSIVPKSPAQ